MTTIQYALPLSRVNLRHVDKVGGKSASLGELLKAGIPVPDGFTTTVGAYFKYLSDNDLEERIYSMLAQIDPDDETALNEASEFIRIWVMDTPLPNGFIKAIKREYDKLGADIRVAVRSSANAEDGDDASFAGMQETFLNVQGADNVVRKVHECLASLFHPRSIAYRVRNNFAHDQVGLAVTVQRMVQSERAGVMFTQNPVGGKDELVIDAIYGLGEFSVGGDVTPDSYVFKETGKVSRTRNDQELMLTLDPSGAENNITVPVPKGLRRRYKLSEDQVRELAEIGRRIEKYYGKPMDVEWGFAGGEFYILQARPTTVESTGVITDVPLTQNEPAKLILEGVFASPGVASGRAVILDGPEDCWKVQKGDILVADMTSPDYGPAFDRAAAVLTARGGRLCHAAITCREVGIPCIVGVPGLLGTLTDGQIITVDASHGEVFEGVAETRLAWDAQCQEASAAKRSEMADVRTDTKIMAILANPFKAVELAKHNVDGVGLVRIEELLAKVGIHPQWFIDNGVEENYINHLALALLVFCQSFDGRDVIVRTTDFKQNEMRGLKFGDQYEPDEEENPMLGWRGARRYIGSPEVFAMEVEAIKRVREIYPNLHVMVPFVRAVEEMVWVSKFLAERGLVRGENGFKLWMMTEIPANVFLLEDFLQHVDGVSIGSNDLTQLVLGADRDNERFDGIYDETHPAVIQAIEHIVTTTRKLGKTVGLCGQAATNHESIVELLVKHGATSISVSPDTIDIARGIVSKMEQDSVK